MSKEVFPELPLDEWEDTKDTLQLYLQIIGKIRLKLFPKMNHWWHVPFYLSAKGLTTRPIPYGDMQFEMSFDLNDHVFEIIASDGRKKHMALKDGLSVAEFHDKVFSMLKGLGIEARIWATPYDVPDISTRRFSEDKVHKSYDKVYANRYWLVLSRVDSVFQQYRGLFTGKSTPPHLFWHHMDLAVTRFSGRPAQAREGAGIVEREAYSHENISVGFWAGDRNVREPAFYGYAYPANDALFDEPLGPDRAMWNKEAGMAIYMYNDLRKEADPKKALLEFLQSVYDAGAKALKWDSDAFRLS